MSSIQNFYIFCIVRNKCGPSPFLNHSMNFSLYFVIKTSVCKRLLVRDQQVQNVTWEALEPVLRGLVTGEALRPLGFGTCGGEWALDGLSPVLRINNYVEGDFIGLHLDSQFSASSNHRSLLTVLASLCIRRGCIRRCWRRHKPLHRSTGLLSSVHFRFWRTHVPRERKPS